MALRKARAVAASSADVEAAAEEVLGKGNAVDAVVAGAFAACAASPGVLLGPVQIGEWSTKDSGARREFTTGSRRDSRRGKGRFDLISPIAIRRLAGN